MMITTRTLMGLPVIVNDSSVPVYRTLTPKPWHRGRCYSARVEKKWRNRFGVIGQRMLIPNGQCFSSNGDFGKCLIMNSATLSEFLRQELRK